MWLQFFLTALVAAAILLAPGLSSLIASSKFRWDRIGYVPLISFAIYGLNGVVLGAMQFRLSWFSFVLLASITGLLFGILLLLLLKDDSSVEGSRESSSKPNEYFKLILIYVTMALGVACVVFVKNLDGPASFIQEIDNVWHLDVIEQFASTNIYSSLSASFYPESKLGFIPPYDATPGFYPASWHTVVALCMAAFDVPATLAVNAVNFVLVGLVYPLSLSTLMFALFKDRKLLFYGSVLSLAFVAFPWQLLVFGPIYPNLAGFALVPALCASFIQSIGPSSEVDNRGLYIFIVAMGIFAELFTQPNGAFTAALLLSPYLVYRIYVEVKARINCDSWQSVIPILVGIVVTVLIAIVWYVLYKHPFMHDTVTFNWPSLSSVPRAIYNTVSLALNYNAIPQFFLSILVICGFVRCFKDPSHTWLAFSFLLASLVLVISTSIEGSLKQYLAGFWYTDTYRLSANVVLAAIPLSVIGLGGILDFCSRYFISKSRAFVEVIPLFVPLIFLLYLVCSTIILPGGERMPLPFGDMENKIEISNRRFRINVLSNDEINFVNQVIDVVPEGALILNSPNDGSCFLPSFTDLNLYYRDVNTSERSSETEESRAIRLSLDNYASDESVNAAVMSTDAEYVLLLDADGSFNDFRRYMISYDPNQWIGFNRISDDTPGFEVVLKDGDMRLYRILV